MENYALTRRVPQYLDLLPEIEANYATLMRPTFTLPEQPATELVRALRDIELERIYSQRTTRSEELWTQRWELEQRQAHERQLMLAEAKASYKRTVAECITAVSITALQRGVLVGGIRMKYREGGWFSTFEETSLHIDYA